MNQVFPLVGFALAAASVSLTAAAHISLDAPVSRYYLAASSEADQSKLKSGPCGVTGDKRTSSLSLITTFKPGETITVSWRETVQHPGHYRIAFDSDGQDFPMPGAAVPSGVTLLVDNIPDKTGSNGLAYSQQVTLPNVECSNCTLQLIEVMTTAAPPYAASDLYYNCADLVLKAASGAGGAPSTGGTQGRGGSTATGGVAAAAGGFLGSGGTLSTGGARATGGARSSGGVTSSVGGTSMSVGGASTSAGGASTSVGGASMSIGGASTSIGGASTSIGGASTSVGGVSTQGGNTALGGTFTTSVTAVGSSSATGGAPGTGVTTRGATGQTNTGNTVPVASSSNDGGCGCHVEQTARTSASISAMLLALMLLARANYRRNSNASSR